MGLVSSARSNVERRTNVFGSHRWEGSMGYRVRSFIVGSAVVALSAVAQVPAANAAFDQTPPSLTVNVTPSFVVGNVVTDDQIDTVHYTRDIEQLIQWSATDDVGVCSYDLFAVPAGAPPEMLLEFSQETEYTYAPGSDYNGDFGGGSNVIDGFVVTARDCNGNATTKAVDEHIFVFQEDGLSPTDGPQSLTYTGTWGQGNCTCFLAGHTASAMLSGARATFTRTF